MATNNQNKGLTMTTKQRIAQIVANMASQSEQYVIAIRMGDTIQAAYHMKNKRWLRSEYYRLTPL